MRTRRYRWDTGLRVRVLGLVVFLLLVVFGLGAMLSETFVRVERLQERADQTRQNMVMMEEVTGSFAELTSALRGYLLSGQDDFLNPYSSANIRVHSLLAQLKASSTADPAQATRVNQIIDLVERWQTSVAEPEIAAKRAGNPTAGNLVSSGTGLSYTEEIRATGQAYVSTEATRLESELASARSASVYMRLLTWAGASLAAALALIGFLIFARGVTRATRKLAAAAEAIARGERGVVIEDTLGGELQEVAEAFSSMSMTLAAQEEELTAQQEELVAQNEQLMAQQEQLQERAKTLELQDARLSRLNRMGEAMIGTIELEQLGRVILDELIDLFGGTGGALLVSSEYGDRMILRVQRWLSPRLVGKTVPIAGPIAQCMATGDVILSRYPETMTKLPVWDTEAPAAQEVYVPLIHAGRVLAVVVVACAKSGALPPETLGLCPGLSRQAATAVAAALNHDEVRRALQSLQEQAAHVEELNAQLEEERDRAAAQLDIYLSIVTTMRAGAWMTDTGGRLLVVNDTFRKFFGEVPPEATMDEVLSRVSAQLMPNDTFPETVRSLVYGREGTGEGVLRLVTGYVLQWSSAPVGRGNDPVGRLFTFQDVTELAELDRLKSEFVNTVSHELRTPLTSIMGYLSLVVSGQVGPLQPQQKEFLEVVIRNTSRLASLINDLLDIQRIESGRNPVQPRWVSLTKVVGQAAETLRMAAAQKGLAFQVNLPEQDLPDVFADPERLMQIATNLISNAVKYTKEGGVTITVRAEGQEQVLEVSDTGIGIPPAEQERIFEKFYRGEDRYVREVGGTGLGLSIVRQLVEEHGGTVSVSSQPGVGSCFTVRFPMQVPQEVRH